MLEFKTLNQMTPDDQSYYWGLTLTYWEPVIIHSKIKDLYWDRVKSFFPEYQWYLYNDRGQCLGFGNTLPLYYSGTNEDLPDRGWDWMVQRAVAQFEQGVEPNCLGGLQIVVFSSYRQQGYSRIILQQIKSWFRTSTLHRFILPIRPIFKDRHPEISMEEYMTWESHGIAYDPWIRLHLSQGGRMIKVCERSMEVIGDKAEWQRWTGISINGSGHYPVPGGLSEIEFSSESDLGIYREPNIWTVYEKDMP